ncbi:MAG: hypothetical protein AAF085_13325, partial [Planctomycetota bacterium]
MIYTVWLLLGLLLAFVAFMVLVSFFRAHRRFESHYENISIDQSRLESQQLSNAIRERRQQHLKQLADKELALDKSDENESRVSSCRHSGAIAGSLIGLSWLLVAAVLWAYPTGVVARRSGVSRNSYGVLEAWVRKNSYLRGRSGQH